MPVYILRNRFFVWLMSAGLASTVWAAGLLICPKCGFEADGTPVLCAHCGAVLPVAKTEPVPAVNPVMLAEKQLATISDLALEATQVDKRLADESLAARPGLAIAYYENALALGRLVKREGGAADAGKSLAESLEKCRKVLMVTTRPCSACNGTGRRAMQVQSLSGVKGGSAATKSKIMAGPTCTTCSGLGMVSGGRSVNELRVLIAQGRRAFETRQQGLGRVACGRVWTPPALLALLDVRAQAMLRTACPAPCSACMGIGQQDCAGCKGRGIVKCTGDGCVDGFVSRKESNSLTAKAVVIRKEACSVCQGSAFVHCQDCRGLGTLPCKHCNGTGRNAACLDCGGQGWSLCAKCRGAGSISGAPCPECLGVKDRICPKCAGEGCLPK